MNTRCI